MATKEKTIHQTPAEPAVPGTETPRPVQDPWDVKVTMFVPRKQTGDEQQYYVAINDRKFLVPANGKAQELPQPVAEVLAASLEQEAMAEKMSDEITKEAIENAGKM